MQTLAETPGFRFIGVDDTAYTPEGSWGIPAQFTYGNAGWAILRAQTASMWIFQFLSSSPLAKKVHLQLRAEFFNLVSHPQFDLPGQAIRSPSAGVITATVGTPRDIQFSLRLLF